MEIQLIVLALTAPAALGKQLAQQNIFYSLWGFPHFQRLLRFPKITKQLLKTFAMFSDTSDVIDIFTSEDNYREVCHPSPRCGLV